jgi:hypothetical protein
MWHKQLKIKHLDLEVIPRFYLLLIILYTLSLLIFSTRLIVFGKIVPWPFSFIIHISSILFLYFLYFTIKNATKTGVFIAIFFHIIFITNSSLIFFEKTPIIIIKGIKPTPYMLKISIVAVASLIINIFLIICLLFYINNKDNK